MFERLKRYPNALFDLLQDNCANWYAQPEQDAKFVAKAGGQTKLQ